MPRAKKPSTKVRTGVTTGTAVAMLFLTASAAFAAAAFTKVTIKSPNKIQLPIVDITPVVDYGDDLTPLFKKLKISLKVVSPSPIMFSNEPVQPLRLRDLGGAFFGRTYGVEFVRRDGSVVNLDDRDMLLFIGSTSVAAGGYFRGGGTTTLVVDGTINLKEALKNNVSAVRVTADPQNQIAEANETNNTMIIPIIYPEGAFGE